jgi:hypothetical protein
VAGAFLLNYGYGDYSTTGEPRPEPREAPVPLVVVQVGSRIRFTTAQLRRLDELPDSCSAVLEVERLVREGDGSITVGVKPVADVMEGLA